MSKHRDIKLSLQKEEKLFAVKTKSSYYEVFDTKVISTRNEEKKKKELMNKPVYFWLSILELSKILMYEFCMNMSYGKPKYGEKGKVCHMDTDSFIVYVKTDDIYKDVETRFNTSNYELNRLLPKGKNNERSMKELMKCQLGGKVWENLFN